MNYMFNECNSLVNLNLLNFTNKDPTCITGMFSNCSSLKELNYPNFKIENKTKIDNDIFYGCPEEIKKKFRKQNNNK